MEIKDFEDIESWAQEQFGKAKLGDARRTVRAVKVGGALSAQPAASLPTQFSEWKDLKAAYRLFDTEEVTPEAVGQPHWELTRQRARESEASVVLFVQDKSEAEFSHHRATKGLGHVGKFGRGIIFQSALAVVPAEETTEILGMAAQRVWLRKHEKRKGRETRQARRDRKEKESAIWSELLEEIGPAPDPAQGPRFVSVGDRESDIFGYVRRAQELDWDVLLRVAQDRLIITPEGEEAHLLRWARQLPAQTTKQIELRGRDGKPGRKLTLEVAFSAVTLRPPRCGPERQQAPIRGWVVRCWAKGPDNKEELEWILFTTVPVSEAEEAKRIIEWYSSRWTIEEYHKCLKTGCAMEERQLETARRLQALFGFLAVVAVRLLQLRTLSREEPQRLAVEVVPRTMVEVVKAKLSLKKKVEEISIREFWHGAARLGGFIGRKSDGDPGWQTLWRGWQRLQDLCWGLESP